MQSAPDTVEGSRCGQSIETAVSIDWPHREWLIGASAGCRNQKLIILSFRLSTIAEQSATQRKKACGGVDDGGAVLRASTVI